jgi:ATP-dependent RNA helicase DDX10/DBP4
LEIFSQVKFTYEAFRRLRPGIPLMALYGKQNQIKRVAIYNDFCKKTSAVLFATDIAARGLGE